MRGFMTVLMAGILLTVSSFGAERRAPDDRIEVLQKRIASLEKELTLLKTAIEVADGTMRLTIKKDKRDGDRRK